MSKKITGAEYPLSKIFSSDFAYRIPSYQRPYAWTTDEAGTLLDDLLTFSSCENEDDSYFLGSIVLIKEESKPPCDVVDGQQRLTTLTILFAALASLIETAKTRESVEKLLQDPGDVISGIDPNPRLRLRDKDQPFFEKHVQGMIIQPMLDFDRTKTRLQTESQERICENFKLFYDKLKENFTTEKALITFGQFLAQRCFLVVVSTISAQSAFRVFSVMNDRGMDLLPTDIIKADVIGKIQHNQDDYNELWENLEQSTGRKGFEELFGHVRMIFTKSKLRKNLLDEFREFVIKQVQTPEDLIDHVLTPYADAYNEIKNMNYASVMNAQDINAMIAWLKRIDNSDWIPPSILFLTQKRGDPLYVAWFFTQMERLAAFMHAASKDVNYRIARYAKIITEMEQQPHSLTDPLKSITLTDVEKTAFLQVLAGDIYGLTAIRRNYIMLRLDHFVSAGGAVYDTSVLTIEHVLPQTVEPGSQWDTDWPNAADRELWLHKIANLVPLTRKKNSQAQNYDFTKKKALYFMGKSGTSVYALASQVLAESVWTPQTVGARQAKLMAQFKKMWDL